MDSVLQTALREVELANRGTCPASFGLQVQRQSLSSEVGMKTTDACNVVTTRKDDESAREVVPNPKINSTQVQEV